MSLIRFLDVSIDQNQDLDYGKEITIDDLLVWSSGRNPVIFKDKKWPLKMDKSMDFCGNDKPQRWERLMSAIIFCLSGQIPDRQEVLRGRQIISQLPKWFKRKYLSLEFVFSFLPYLLIGIKSHMGRHFQEDSNRIEDVIGFLVSFFEGEVVEIESCLCAHRGYSEPSFHTLIQKIDVIKASKTFNLQAALLLNVKHLKVRKIRWNQQKATEKASSNMFPEMFLQYAYDGLIPDMLLLLDQHFLDLKSLIKKKVRTAEVEVDLMNMDSHTLSVCDLLKEWYGDYWRFIDYRVLNSDNPVVNIALNNTISEVKRFMPFYNKFNPSLLSCRQDLLGRNLVRASELSNDKGIILATRDAINWFFNNQLMHITAKALYETVFFYAWGFRSATQNLYSVGIDRDHAEYQYEAWKMGYEDGCRGIKKEKACNSILYMRRNTKEVVGSFLRDISFRQFWR